jgi:hypothetical protein
MSEESRDERWLDQAANQTKLFYALGALCILLFVADFIVHRHAHFEVEGVSGFYPVFGFAAYALIVGAGWIWRRVVLRREDYYDA